MHEISSKENPFVKQVLSLQKKRNRKTEKEFIIEGFSEISMAASSSYNLKCLCYCLDLLRKDARKLVESLEKRGTKILQCPEALFKKMSYRENPDGLLALAETQLHSFTDFICTQNSFFIVLEKLEKPGNLGAILRSCDAAGASGVIVVDEGVDIYHPNVIFASRGTLFTIPIVISNIQKCWQWLKNHNITIFAATPEAKVDYFQIKKLPCAFVLGREHEGLSSFWKENADELVKIPMEGKVDSLNVSVSSALLLFEAKRWQSQR